MGRAFDFGVVTKVSTVAGVEVPAAVAVVAGTRPAAVASTVEATSRDTRRRGRGVVECTGMDLFLRPLVTAPRGTPYGNHDVSVAVTVARTTES